MRPRCRLILAAAALAGSLHACGRGGDASDPIDLLETAAPARVVPVELRGETRRALAAELDSPIELEVTMPEDPILGFAIGASSPERPTLLVPVVFRILANGTEVFREEIRRAQGRRWHPRAVDLAPYGGREVQLSLEVRRGEGGVEGGESHVVAHWGNPVIRGKEPPEIGALILVTVDCLRADHVGAYGYSRDTTPNLDAFAREGTLFRNATAVSSYTLPTHASMLTGLPPSLHGAAARSRISSDLETLPERLSAEGFRVQGLVSGPFLAPTYGFADGFDTYRLSSTRAADLVDGALALLEESAGFRRFLFLHVFDVHAPYSPPEEFLSRFGERPEDVSRLHDMVQKKLPPGKPEDVERVKNLYDAELAYVDREIGRFFAELRRRNLYHSSLIVVTADHGEAFYEHGSWEHGRPWQDDGPRLYQEILHVPLLVKPPNGRGGSVVEEVVSEADVFATFLDAAGLPGDGPWSKSLLRPRGHQENAWALSEFVALPRDRGALLEIVFRRENLKYRGLHRADSLDALYASSPFEESVHDLASDPLERRNLLLQDPAGAASLREAVRRYLLLAREHRSRARHEELSLDPETLRELESLGYIER